jgi:hypothetical protein
MLKGYAINQKRLAAIHTKDYLTNEYFFDKINILEG